MAELEAVIGLEIHVQLATRTKMFCGCALSFGDEPNVHTCPVCLAHPGVLPVPNEEAIRYALKIAAALGVRDRAALDLPPQELLLSRQPEGLPDQPVRHSACLRRAPRRGSASTAPTSRRTRRRRSTSASRAGSTAPSASLVDFNRGGTPLVEIVTEPDLRSAAEAGAWARLLRDHGPPARRLRRQHGGGQPAGRRQRLGAPGRQRGARDQDRAEEHEQLPLPRARDRGRAGAPARAGRGGGDRRSGDAPLRPGATAR